MPIDEYLNRIKALALTYRRVSTITLSEVLLNEDEAYGALLKSYPEAYVLQTCNRIEIYVYGDDVAPALGIFKGRKVADKVDVLVGIDAVRHLFRVASGLESLALGESEILGQVEEAFDKARRRGALGSLLGFTVERAIKVGKEVRRRYPAISLGPSSIGSLAVEYIYRLVGNGVRVLVVGAGSVASTVVKRLWEKGFRNVVVANRTVEKAKDLSLRYGYSYVGLDGLANLIKGFDVVFFATSSPKPLINADEVRYNGRPIIVDLGVPRNVAGASVTIDDLKPLQAELMNAKERAVRDASSFIEGELARFRELFAQRVIEVELSELIQWAYDVSGREVDKALDKGLVNGDVNGLKALARFTAKKIMQPLIAYVKGLANEGRFDEAVQFINSIKEYVRRGG